MTDKKKKNTFDDRVFGDDGQGILIFDENGKQLNTKDDKFIKSNKRKVVKKKDAQ